MLLFFYTGKFGIDHDASAIFTNDNFFTHLDIELSLRRDAVEATTARITLDIDHSQTVAGILTNTFESREQTGLNLVFEFFGLLSTSLHLVSSPKRFRRARSSFRPGCADDPATPLPKQLPLCSWPLVKQYTR